MRAPFGWWAPAVAAVATGVAVWAGDHLELSIPASLVAVAAAGFLLADAASRSRASRVVPRAARVAGASENLRASFRSGRYGREKVLAALDRVERHLRPPGPDARPLEQIEQIVGGTDAEFRAYVAARLAAIERDL